MTRNTQKAQGSGAGDRVKRVAVALWVQEAARAAPNVAKGRNATTFDDQNEQEKKKWLNQASAAVDAISQPPEASDAEPVAWKCQERTMGAWYTRYVDERPTGERYRNIVPLYAHPPAAEPVGLREAVEGIDDDYMTSEKHHPGYVLIPTAKFEQIVSAAERAKEIVPPHYVNWHHDAAQALATPARTDDAGVGGDENAIAAIIKAQMREQWDEICSDSGCHPLDIEKRGRSTYYEDRHWTSAVAKYAAQDILAALSPAPDRREGEA